MESGELSISSVDYEEIILETLYTGVEINYSLICPTKLWLFSRQLGREDDSDLVLIGKILHKETFKKAVKEVGLDRIKIDFITRKDSIVIHEVKHSNKMEDADRLQMLYYIYHLRSKGIKNVYGIIHYPRLKKMIQVYLDDKGLKNLKDALDNIKRIENLDHPPAAVKKAICNRCSYYEFCWVD